jgi:probable O-glycosylation ligase (exosortase A-associated)
VAVSVVNALDPKLCYNQFSLFERELLMAGLIPVIVQREEQLRRLLFVIAASLGVVGCKFALYGLRQGGVRFESGYGGCFGDNNGLALAMAMAAPLCWYAAQLSGSRLGKVILFGMSFCCAATVVQTFARGGALALGTAAAVVVWKSRRRATGLAILVLLVIGVVSFMGVPYTSRLATIAEYHSDRSASQRLELYGVAIALAQQFPLFGVGFGGENFANAAAEYLRRDNDLVAHNTYLQVLVDSGVFAFGLYVSLLFGTIAWLYWSAKQSEQHRSREAALYPRALSTALIAFAVGSTFYSRVLFEPYYVVLLCSASWHLIYYRSSGPSSVQEQCAETSISKLDKPRECRLTKRRISRIPVCPRVHLSGEW